MLCVCVLSVSCSPHHLLHSLSIAANNFKAKGDYICALGFVQRFLLCIASMTQITLNGEKKKLKRIAHLKYQRF